MKTLLAIALTLLAFSANAQKIELSYEPKGQIIKFYYHNVTIYTDTSALFSFYPGTDKKDKSHYDARVKERVMQQFAYNKSDTVIFAGAIAIYSGHVADWDTEYPILELIKLNKAKVIDKHRQSVQVIISQKTGTRRGGLVKRSFINERTGEELWRKTLYDKHRGDWHE
jgi:hypothetical protein